MTKSILPTIAAAIAVTVAGAGIANTSAAGQFVKQHGSEKAGLLIWNPSRSVLPAPSKRASTKLPAVQKGKLIGPQFRPPKSVGRNATLYRPSKKSELIAPMYRPPEKSRK